MKVHASLRNIEWLLHVHERMRIEFTANTATFTEIDEAFIAGIAVGDGSKIYLTFQRSMVEGPDDWGVYLEYNDQIHGDYDLVSECRLTRDHVEVDLSERLGGLEDIDGFTVSLQVDDETFILFAKGLMKVFQGKARALLKVHNKASQVTSQ